MIKDKIIEMENGKEYYILEEVSYNGKKYLLSAECNLDKDEINEEDYLVMELEIENNNLKINTIEDDKLAVIVTNMLINKVRNED